MYLGVVAQVALVGELLAAVATEERLEVQVQRDHVRVQLGRRREAVRAELTRPLALRQVRVLGLLVLLQRLAVRKHLLAHTAVRTVGRPVASRLGTQS